MYTHAHEIYTYAGRHWHPLIAGRRRGSFDATSINIWSAARRCDRPPVRCLLLRYAPVPLTRWSIEWVLCLSCMCTYIFWADVGGFPFLVVWQLRNPYLYPCRVSRDACMEGIQRMQRSVRASWFVLCRCSIRNTYTFDPLAEKTYHH